MKTTIQLLFILLSFFPLSVFLGFLYFSKKKERLLYRGKRNEKERRRNNNKRKDYTQLYLLPDKVKIKVFCLFCFSLVLHHSPYLACSSLSLHPISISIITHTHMCLCQKKNTLHIINSQNLTTDLTEENLERLL